MRDIAGFAKETIEVLDETLKDVRIPRANLGPCPVCGHDIVENRKGYSCWSREDPGCGFVIWKTKAGKQLPLTVARELIATGRTERPVTGFRGRSGRSFRARLALMQTPEGKWRVEFDEPWAREGAKPPEAEAEVETGPRGGGGGKGLGASCAKVALAGGECHGAACERRAAAKLEQCRPRVSPPWSAMALTLVTGPANSAKAQLVLDRYRAALARGAILVVPRAADVEHYRRELASDGAVLGVRVESFNGLMREIARRAGVTEVALGEQARERVLATVVATAPLELLAGAAAAPGFVRSLARFVAELESRRVHPARLVTALRAWAPGPTRRARYGEELAALYGGYRRALERLGRLDGELLATRALDALRLAPARWGRTPVFCYGFDDLDPLQLDAVETLAHRVGTQVTLSLPGEPGRVALAGRAATLETLRPAAEEVLTQGPLDTYYEDPTLHHLERSLFEDAPSARAPGSAVRLLEGGDERAEAELIGAEIADLIAAGCAPGDIAVVSRGSPSVGALVAQVLAVREVPHTAARRERFADSPLGGGLLALLRAGLLSGGAADLVGWLRAPGVVAQTAFVDRFEAELLNGGIGELGPARGLWEREHWPLDALDRLAEAARRPGTALLERVERELEAMFAAPWRREAALLDPWQAAVLGAGRRTLRELRELTRADASFAPGPAAIVAALEGVIVELAAAGDVDAVLICDALALRARRVRGLFIAGLQEGAFPAPPREEPFLAAAERAELAQASGLVLGGPAEPSPPSATCSTHCARDPRAGCA